MPKPVCNDFIDLLNGEHSLISSAKMNKLNKVLKNLVHPRNIPLNSNAVTDLGFHKSQSKLKKCIL
jgi:hypothetical protein